MTITAPTHADILPVGPSIDDPDNFDIEADAFVAAQRPFGIQLNALGDNVYANALAVKDLADSAATSAATATAQANTAATQAGIASTKAATATAKAQEAADSAAAAANSATGVTAASSSSLVLSNGSKTFVVPVGKQFQASMPVVAASTGTAGVRMFGSVASYLGPNLTITVTLTEGAAGSYNDWSISPSGAQGPTGGTAGGQLADALDEKKASAPAASSTPAIWNAGGNYVPITATTTITGLPNAPQAGAKRTMKAEAAFAVVSSANFYVHGGSTLITPGDELDVVADTVSKFLVTVRRNGGNVVGGWRNAREYLASTVWSASVSGMHRIILAAGSGSGAVAKAENGSSAAASCGSSGGICIKDFYANAGDSYTLTLGARGLGVTLVNATFDQAANGNNSEDSSFIGPNVSIIAGGGKGGKGAVSASGVVVAAAAIGGTASGGDYNFNGANSGAVSVAMNACSGASGGVAASWTGAAFSSGSVTVTGASTQNRYASGGAGVGGKSGDVSGADNLACASGGGGSVAASSNRTTAGASAGGPGRDGQFLVLSSTPLNLAAAGSAGIASNANSASIDALSAGAGTGGVACTGSYSSGSVNMLGGSGGVAAYFSSGGLTYSSGNVTFGGSSGGVAAASATTGTVTVTSGNAGAAFALILSP